MARILVIEDVKDIRNGLMQVLKGAGHEVLEASQGNEAETQFRANPTDLVITDIFMPESDGLDVIMTLKKEYPETKIIAISGDNPSGDFANTLDMLGIAKKMGASHTIAKPFGSKELLEAVSQVLGD